MAFCWRTDDDPTLNAGLVAAIFEWIRTCNFRKPYISVIFQSGGVRTPCPLLLISTWSDLSMTFPDSKQFGPSSSYHIMARSVYAYWVISTCTSHSRRISKLHVLSRPAFLSLYVYICSECHLLVYISFSYN